MEIGPIPGVRAVRVVSALERESVHPLDETLEAVARLGDDTYSGNGDAPERGLESDEDGPEKGTAGERRTGGDQGWDGVEGDHHLDVVA